MFTELTDDQLALVGCAVALFSTGLLMSISTLFAKSSSKDSGRLTHKSLESSEPPDHRRAA